MQPPAGAPWLVSHLGRGGRGKGCLFVSAAVDGTVRVWDSATREVRGHFCPILSINEYIFPAGFAHEVHDRHKCRRRPSNRLSLLTLASEKGYYPQEYGNALRVVGRVSGRDFDRHFALRLQPDIPNNLDSKPSNIHHNLDSKPSNIHHKTLLLALGSQSLIPKLMCPASRTRRGAVCLGNSDLALRIHESQKV